MPVVNAASLAHEGGMTPSLADVPLKQVMQAVGSETEFASNLPFCGIRRLICRCLQKKHPCKNRVLIALKLLLLHHS